MAGLTISLKLLVPCKGATTLSLWFSLRNRSRLRLVLSLGYQKGNLEWAQIEDLVVCPGILLLPLNQYWQALSQQVMSNAHQSWWVCVHSDTFIFQHLAIELSTYCTAIDTITVPRKIPGVPKTIFLEFFVNVWFFILWFSGRHLGKNVASVFTFFGLWKG